MEEKIVYTKVQHYGKKKKAFRIVEDKVRNGTINNMSKRGHVSGG